MPSEQAETLHTKILREGAIKAKGSLPRERAAAALVLERLAQLGIESTGTWLRRPPLEQLRALVAKGPVREKELARALKGVTPPERKRAIDAALRERSVVRVLRGREVFLAAPSEAWLDAAGSQELARVTGELAKLVKSLKIGKPGALALERSALTVFEKALHELAACLAEDVLWSALVSRSEREIVSVPELVRAAGLPAEDARRALLRLDREGLVELRAESGIALLSEADATLCPRGSDGFPLSFLRRVGAVDAKPLRA
jgi:hypothetical protein